MIDLGIDGFEFGDHGAHVCGGFHGAQCRTDFDVLELAGVAHHQEGFGADFVRRVAVGQHFIDGGFLEISPDAGHFLAESGKRLVIGIGRNIDLRRDRMTAHVIRRGAAEGREGGGELEGDDVLEADAAAASRQMQWPRAAIGQQRILRGMNTLAGDHPAQRLIGVLLQHVDHAFSGFLKSHAQHIGAFFLEDAGGLLDVEDHLAAKKVMRIETAEDGIAIGNRRLHAATVEADGAWIGTGTLGSEAHLPGQRIDLDDHAGASPDGVEMQGRHIEFETVHDRFVLDAGGPLGDHPHVETRATHVGTDQRVIANEFANIGGAEDAADRAGDHRLVQARMMDRGQAAKRQQRLHAIFESVFLRGVLDALQLLAAARRGIGLDQH